MNRSIVVIRDCRCSKHFQNWIGTGQVLIRCFETVNGGMIRLLPGFTLSVSVRAVHWLQAGLVCSQLIFPACVGRRQQLRVPLRL